VTRHTFSRAHSSQHWSSILCSSTALQKRIPFQCQRQVPRITMIKLSFFFLFALLRSLEKRPSCCCFLHLSACLPAPFLVCGQVLKEVDANGVASYGDPFITIAQALIASTCRIAITAGDIWPGLVTLAPIGWVPPPEDPLQFLGVSLDPRSCRSSTLSKYSLSLEDHLKDLLLKVRCLAMLALLLHLFCLLRLLLPPFFHPFIPGVLFCTLLRCHHTSP